MNSTKELFRLKAFSDKEFSQADRIDKIRMHLIDPSNISLNAKDEQYLVRLNAAFNIMCSNYRQLMVIRLIKAAFPEMRHVDVVKLISDAQTLYSNVIERNVLFDKIMQRERILKHLEFCEQTMRIKELALFEEMLRKLDSEIDQLQKTELPKTRELPTVQFSMDPKVLHQAISGHLKTTIPDEEE